VRIVVAAVLAAAADAVPVAHRLQKLVWALSLVQKPLKYRGIQLDSSPMQT
jgi:hypothetical protein